MPHMLGGWGGIVSDGFVKEYAFDKFNHLNLLSQLDQH